MAGSLPKPGFEWTKLMSMKKELPDPGSAAVLIPDSRAPNVALTKLALGSVVGLGLTFGVRERQESERPSMRLTKV